MALTLEWRRRIELWRKVMPTLFFQPCQDVAWEAFLTMDRLDPARAAKGPFKPVRKGWRWGLPWQYGWFRARLRAPRESAGRRLVLRGALGGDALVLVNGEARGTWDRQHPEITLARSGRAGRTYSVLAEAYSGSGPYLVGDGPVPDGVDYIPKRVGPQATLGDSSLGFWEEELYQAWLDYETLFQTREELDPDALRVSEIDEGLRNFTLVVDLELPLDRLRGAVRKGRALLAPLLACRNGSTAPTLHCFGHSHIDVAWLWPLVETQRKCGRTFSTQIALMEEYPEFRFLQSQPHLYRMAREDYPELYRRMQARVKKGQWLPEGGMWVEADTNISGGEALVRQFLHGKRFFKDAFGIESELMWLPDVFGYSGAMPQIMKGCGIKYFSTAKIFWNYYGGDTFPYNTFWWEGIDGSRIFAHMHNDYNAQTEPAHLARRWKERVQKDGLKGRLVPFGWGDGGGGVTRDHLEFLRRARDLEGLPKTTQESPVGFLRREAVRRKDWPVYVGELYFQAHRGTYTTQGHTKRGNRKGEFALREAEIWGSAALALKGARYPAQAMDAAWKGLLLNQFHDILPGSGIARIYQDAEAEYGRVLRTSEDTARSSALKLLRKGGARGALTVFNPLAWERDALVEVPDGRALEDSAGRPLPLQIHEGRHYAGVSALPSLGWSTLKPASRAARAVPAASGGLSVSAGHLENRWLRVRIDARGEVESIYDKEHSREWAAGTCNALRLYRDVPSVHDAWDVDSHYKQAPVRLDAPARVRVSARGPLFASLSVARKIGSSDLRQEIRLAADSRRLDFITEVDWREKHRLLKVNFPVNVAAEQALHEIQYGHLSRPTHASRQYDADRFEVCSHKWSALAETRRGAAVLNDCKYGVNVEGNSINLSLLRSPLAPDPTADRRRHNFTYAFYCWEGDDGIASLVREAYALNTEARVLPGEGGGASLLAVDATNIVLEVLKPAEDGSGDLVLRAYEAARTATRAVLSVGLPFAQAHEADMLEKAGKRLPSEGGNIALDFRPFEIKTLRLKRKTRGT